MSFDCCIKYELGSVYGVYSEFYKLVVHVMLYGCSRWIREMDINDDNQITVSLY